MPLNGQLTIRIMNEKKQNLHNLRGAFNVLHVSGYPTTIKALANFKEQVAANSGNTYHEQIQSVSYNSHLQLLEAIVSTKRDSGYNNDLCTTCSYAFIRFHFNYGTDWQDPGYGVFNEHNIPTGNNCTKNSEKPLSHSSYLKIIPETNKCSVHVLHATRAVFERNQIPPENDLNYSSVWGNTFDDHIQIKPKNECVVVSLVL